MLSSSKWTFWKDLVVPTHLLFSLWNCYLTRHESWWKMSSHVKCIASFWTIQSRAKLPKINPSRTTIGWRFPDACFGSMSPLAAAITTRGVVIGRTGATKAKDATRAPAMQAAAKRAMAEARLSKRQKGNFWATRKLRKVPVEDEKTLRPDFLRYVVGTMNCNWDSFSTRKLYCLISSSVPGPPLR